MMSKLAVFDFGSTLMDDETIDFFADVLGFKYEVVAITERAMAGDYASLVERVALLKGLPQSKVEEICESLPMHGMYGKRGFKRDDGKFHIDIFLDTHTVRLENEIVFENESWKI